MILTYDPAAMSVARLDDGKYAVCQGDAVIRRGFRTEKYADECLDKIRAHDGPIEWLFDGDYDNLDQVAHLWDAYQARHDEVTADGGYPYNALFAGLPGAAGPHEDTAVYLLQRTRHRRHDEARVAEYVAEGFEPLPPMDPHGVVRGDVLMVDSNGSPGLVYRSARVLANGDGNPYAVLPKGKRTNGYSTFGHKVMVKR